MLRHRVGLRQSDVAARVGIAQTTVSAIERGRLDHLGLSTLAKVAGSLDADLVVFIRWRGGELDRLLDERHATLVARIAEIVERAGWETQPELTFSEYGERGSIDLVAWHPSTRTLLVIEVKTELTSVEETLRKHDLKVRLAPKLVRERLGWEPARVGRLLVLPDESTARRRVGRHAALFDRAFPFRALALRRWLRTPTSPMSGLAFVSLRRAGAGRSGPTRRVRRPRDQGSMARDRMAT
jgi:transcriptional regulator with XRE-family HTH domain